MLFHDCGMSVPKKPVDRFYICNNCKKSFAFIDEKEEHETSLGHSQFTILGFDGKLLKDG
jgi:hypothetical protein